MTPFAANARPMSAPTALLMTAACLAALAPAARAAPEPADRAGLDLPAEEEIAEHSSFDPTPALQRTPGGNLIVDAFIMAGPVRVEIRDRDSDAVLLDKESASLFPFEVSREELGVEPGRIKVYIYVDGSLRHELELRDEP